MELGAPFAKGLAYAFETHRHDERKSSGIPYISHLMSVSALVLEHGGNQDESIGALLHDAAEDHGGREQLATITEEFGPTVGQIVEGCSDSLEAEDVQKGPWRERKERYVAHLRAVIESGNAGEMSVVLVSAADKLHNARSILADVLQTGDAVYTRFAGKKAGTLWYYRALSDTYALVPGRHTPMAVELARIVDLLERA
jgi:(p)ppGpp synthase/HD superfamily hydrolase